MNNQDWFECCWDASNETPTPVVHRRFSGIVQVPGYNECEYEGYERNWSVGPGQEQHQGTVFVLRHIDRNWFAHGSSLAESKSNLIQVIMLHMKHEQ